VTWDVEWEAGARLFAKLVMGSAILNSMAGRSLLRDRYARVDRLAWGKSLRGQEKIVMK